MDTSKNNTVLGAPPSANPFPSVAQRLMADVQDIVVVFGHDLAPKWTSEADGTLMGVPLGEWSSGTLMDVVHPDDQAWLQRERQTVLTNPGASLTGRMRVPNPDGSVISIRFTSTNRFDDPDIDGVVMTIHSTSTIEADNAEARARVEPADITFSPQVLVHEIIAAEELASDHPLRCTATVHADVPAQVRGDRDRLRLVLEQLLRSSARLAPDGQVTVEVSRPAGVSIRFEIGDSRKGLRTELLSTSVNGCLGLDDSARSAVEVLNARLSHKREDARTLVALDVDFGHARRIDDRRPAVRPEPTTTNKAHVLVVDDSEVNLLLATSQLDRLGYTWTTATGGDEALALLERENFDAVLMDWHMPGLNGLDATRQWRARRDPHHQLPIITMTASAMTGDRERCLDAGASDYLPKPVSINDLAAMMSKWTRRRAPAPAAAQIYDGSTISTLIKDIGDVSVVRSMVVAFQAMVPAYRDDARSAFDRNDIPTLRRCAHTLKSTALMLGLSDFTKACVTLEKAAADGETDALQSRLAVFVEQSEAAMEQLAELLTDLGTNPSNAS